MKVKIIGNVKSGGKLLKAGTVKEFDDDFATQLIDGGYAEAIGAPAKDENGGKGGTGGTGGKK